MNALRMSVATAAALLAAASLPLLAAGPASAATAVLPWDFDGNGKADLAIGAPGENLGAISDAGSVSVFMADSSGLYTSDTLILNQDTEGVPGGAETGDQFGWALTSGDYDNDGFADLAVAANRENINASYCPSGTCVDAGVVNVFWGSSTGLSGLNSRSLPFDSSAQVRTGSYAGDALASGDINGDGTADLAVGAPGREQARVYYGGAGQTTFGVSLVTFSEDTSGVPGTKHLGGDLFAEAMVIGDFNNDGTDDLAVGAPYDYDDTGFSVGAVTVFPGSATGPNFSESTRWTPDTAGIKGSAHPFAATDLPDSFGRTLAAGDFNGDTFDDLGIGAPGVPLARTSGGTVYQDAGEVHVLYGSATGISDADALISQETIDVTGASSAGDLFGASLAAGTRSSSALGLLAIGSAEEWVRVLPGASGTGSLSITQGTTGVPGSTEPGNAFGAFLRFVDQNGSGNDVLAVGAPGYAASAGAVFLLPSAAGMPTGLNSQMLDEGDDGVLGDFASGDSWGWLGDSH